MKPTRDWVAAALRCAAGLGVGLLFFGLWRSCSAKDSWMARQLSYEDYKATDDSALLLGLLGMALIAVFGLLIRWTADGKREQAERWELKRKEFQAAEEFARKVSQNPDNCPKCGSEEFQTYEPSKPRMWTPLSFAGVLAGLVASSMADAVFKRERVCTRCGCRWPAPS